MDKSITISQNNKSFDEEIIFEVLKKNDISVNYALSANTDNLPNAKDFQALAAGINNGSRNMGVLMYNTAPRPVTSKKKFFAPIIIFFRKVLRKFFLKWYIEPICDQQTQFNIAAHSAVSNLATFSEKQLDAINELYTKQNELMEELKRERELRMELERRIEQFAGGNK